MLASDENARRMAWIPDRYRDTDAATHAAIGIIVQDHFGRDRDEWARQMAVIQGRYPRDRGGRQPGYGINRPARRLPGTTVERTDAEALRSGSISVKVVNRAGDAIARDCRSPSPCGGGAVRPRRQNVLGVSTSAGPRSRGRRPAPAR